MRHVYFSFHYDDVWKANQIRNSYVVAGNRAAGFVDRSLWEEAKSKDDPALKALITEGMNGTSVTVVLIGRETASRRWVKYEIRESVRRGNALLGLHLNCVPDQAGRRARCGRVPHYFKQQNVQVQEWTDVSDFSEWIEEAWRARNRKPTLLGWLFGD
jgi:hypothetical protein